MPTTPETTWTGDRLEPAINSSASYARIINVGGFAPNLDLPAGTILAKITVGGDYAAYDNGNADGTEVALPLITQYPVVTDASGNVTNLGGSGTRSYAPCYTDGPFRCEDIDNLDAPALVDIKGVLIVGDLTTGVFKF